MEVPMGDEQVGTDPGALGRAYFLESEGRYGCAEAVFMALKAAHGIDEVTESSAAMALNGGLADTGGPCGALTGTALAVGMNAERQMDDHADAKRFARELVASTMDAFADEYVAVDRRTLTGYDVRATGGYEAFIASGVWRDGCVRQIEFVVGRPAPLAEPAAWDRRERELESPSPGR